MAKRVTQSEYIDRCVKIHGIDKYDYSATVFIDYKTKVKIYCNNCKEFFYQKPFVHSRGHGCPLCKIERAAKSRTFNTEKFINDSIKIHKGRYQYYKTIYKSDRDKVEIYCPVCDKYFMQIASVHKQGHGCPSCGKRDTALKTRVSKENFIKRSKIIHKNKYDYSSVILDGVESKVKIYCNDCKEFFYMTPHSHLSGQGCVECFRKSISLTKDEFIKRSVITHGEEKYDYSSVEYNGVHKKVKIYCNDCKEFFYVIPQNHMKGHGHKSCCLGKFSPESYGASHKKSTLYINSFFGMDENFYKIGITSKDIDKRFYEIKDYDYEILYQKEFSGYDARALEIELHKLHKQYKYKPFIKFSGHSECFSYIDFDLVKETITGVNCGNHSKR